MPYDPSNVLGLIRASLKRTRTPTEVPAPPVIEEPIARLVYTDIGLAELFARSAVELKMYVELCSIDDLFEKVVDFLKEKNCKSVMLTDTPLLKNLEAAKYLNEQGIVAKMWSEITLDQSYDFDAGLTEVDYAVAETGSLVVKHRPEHGRAISLVPFVHVAIVQPKNLVPDLLDLMEKLQKDGTGSGVTMISGPSKTADIEMNVVIGVHGPNVVKTFVLQ